MNAKLTATEHNAVINDINGILPNVINQVVYMADNHNVERDKLISYFGELLSAITNICTFADWEVDNE